MQVFDDRFQAQSGWNILILLNKQGYLLLFQDMLSNLCFICYKMPFFLNNQPDALITPISFCYKTLHVSGIFSAHHQEFSTVHSALVSFMQVSDDRFQADSGCSILTLLGSGHQRTA